MQNDNSELNNQNLESLINFLKDLTSSYFKTQIFFNEKQTEEEIIEHFHAKVMNFLFSSNNNASEFEQSQIISVQSQNLSNSFDFNEDKYIPILNTFFCEVKKLSSLENPIINDLIEFYADIEKKIQFITNKDKNLLLNEKVKSIIKSLQEKLKFKFQEIKKNGQMTVNNYTEKCIGFLLINSLTKLNEIWTYVKEIGEKFTKLHEKTDISENSHYLSILAKTAVALNEIPFESLLNLKPIQQFNQILSQSISINRENHEKIVKKYNEIYKTIKLNLDSIKGLLNVSKLEGITAILGDQFMDSFSWSERANHLGAKLPFLTPIIKSTFKEVSLAELSEPQYKRKILNMFETIKNSFESLKFSLGALWAFSENALNNLDDIDLVYFSNRNFTNKTFFSSDSTKAGRSTLKKYLKNPQYIDLWNVLQKFVKKILPFRNHAAHNLTSCPQTGYNDKKVYYIKNKKKISIQYKDFEEIFYISISFQPMFKHLIDLHSSRNLLFSNDMMII